jgi:hypothetical protein
MLLPDETSSLQPIHAGGVHLGNAMQHLLGVQFFAVDHSMKDMDRSIWPSNAYAERAARQMFSAAQAGRILDFPK